MTKVARRHSAELGQTTVEYALIVGAISVVMAAALIGVGIGILARAQELLDALP